MTVAQAIVILSNIPNQNADLVIGDFMANIEEIKDNGSYVHIIELDSDY